MKGNVLYVILATLAVVLIGVTIGLQIVILTNRQPGTASNPTLQPATQSVADVNAPAGDNGAQVALAVATPIDAPTQTPVVILIQPTPPPPTLSTFVQDAVAQNAPAQAEFANPTDNAPGVAALPAGDTPVDGPADTAAQPTEQPAEQSTATGNTAVPVADTTAAAIPTLEPPTATVTSTSSSATSSSALVQSPPAPSAIIDVAPVDLVIGYLPEREGCTMVTEIVSHILTETYGYRVGTVPFESAEALHRHVAHEGDAANWADLTFCHTYPDDGAFLQQFGSHIKIMGNDLAESDGQRWYILTFSGLYLPLRTDARCTYEFFESITFTDVRFPEPDAATWLANHAPQVESWTGCIDDE